MVDKADAAPALGEAYSLDWLFPEKLSQKSDAALLIVSINEELCRLSVGSGQAHKCPVLCTTVSCNKKNECIPFMPFGCPAQKSLYKMTQT